MSSFVPPGFTPPVAAAPNAPTTNGALTLRTVGDVTATHGVKCLIYGRPGLGKTVLIATAPNPVIISAERGLLSLRHIAPHLPTFEIKDVSDLERARDWSLNNPEARAFDTICLDSISEIAETCLIAEKKKNSANGFRAYGETADRILAIFRDFRDFAHKHVYFVAKEEYDKDETGGFKYQPSMPGNKLGQAAPYIFDEIFRYETYRDPTSGAITRYLRTAPDNMNIAKDRSGRLDQYERPDLSAIFAKILG